MMRTTVGAIVDPLREPARERRGLDGAAARGQAHCGKSAVEEAIKAELLGVEGLIVAWVKLRDQSSGSYLVDALARSGGSSSLILARISERSPLVVRTPLKYRGAPPKHRGFRGAENLGHAF